jgi:large subunit ribosomal protein L28
MLCGKHPVVGQNIRHIHSGKWKFRAPRTKRSFKPNLQKMTIEGVKILVCTGCMKTLAKPVVVKTPKEVAA